MIFSTQILAHLLLGQSSLDKVRSVELANGSRIHVELLTKSPRIEVALIASSEGVEDTPGTHGYRHLLEHFMANGRTGTLNMKLETRGAAIEATTSRDFTKYSITAAPENLGLALESLADILMPIRVTQEEIKKESNIIGYELSMGSSLRRASMTGWQQLFPARPDTGGTIGIMSRATPEELLQLQSAHFQAGKLLLIIAGPVNLESAQVSATKFFNTIPKGKVEYFPANKPENVMTPVGFSGYAKFLKVFGLPDRRTMVLFGVAREMASRDPELQVTYTPSNRPGVITLYSRSASSFERMKDYGLAHVQRAPFWINAMGQVSENSPSLVVQARASALVWKPLLNLESLGKVSDEITYEEIVRSLEEWKKVEVVKGN